MPVSIIVINLDRDSSRLQHMRTQLDRAGLPFRRFSAVNGAALPPTLTRYFDTKDKSLSAGEIGCYASHLSIFEDIASGAIAAPALVLEDDVDLPTDFARLLERLLAVLPADWDIVRLSYPSKRAALQAGQIDPAHELVRYSQTPVSTGAYLINRAGAEKMLRPAPRNIPIDHDLRRVWAWKLKTFGVAPPPVRADALGVSSIDAMAPGARAERWRSKRIKRQRARETWARFTYGLADFGALRWIGVELLNALGRAVPRPARTRLFAWAQRAWGWRTFDSTQVELTPSHIHAVGALPDAAHAHWRRTLRRGGRS